MTPSSSRSTTRPIFKMLSAWLAVTSLIFQASFAMGEFVTAATSANDNNGGVLRAGEIPPIPPHELPLVGFKGVKNNGQDDENHKDFNNVSDEEVELYGLEESGKSNSNVLATDRTLNEQLSTIAISTFLLELTIQRQSEPFRNRNLRRLGKDDEIASLSVDDLIQSLAEDHLSAVYADAFDNVPDPSQVLLTVVTTNDDKDNQKGSGIYIRQSFVGGVVSFPTSSSNIPSRAELEEVTLEAFAIPGLGEDFLNALNEEEHPDLKGLLLLGAREVSRSDDSDNNADSGGSISSSSGESNVANNGGNNYGYQPTPNESNSSDSNNNGGMNNIWAIAAVAALGAMFLTIILCTTVLYCDWRKRKERRNRKRPLAGRIPQKSSVNGSVAGDRSNISDGVNSGNNTDASLRIVVPAASGETEDHTPSPSTQGSDDHINMMAGSSNGASNTVGKGTLTGKMSSIRMSRPKNASRSTSVGRIALPALTKSKAANAELEQSAGPAEDDSYVPEVAPSVTYSVGEDTTMLYPTINRGRQNSRDDVSDGEFDGYSVDAASTLDPYGYETPGVKGRGSGSKGGGSSMYSGDIPRDFDSVWDDESKMTAQGMGGGDDDTFMSEGNVNNKLPTTTLEMSEETKKYGDLSHSLNELVENQYGSKSPDSSKNVNLYELDSGSESGSSNRGAFTLELLGNNKASKGKKSVDDEDSILGDMYSQDGSLADESALGGDKVPSSADSVDSTPSWAAPIQSALLRSNNAAKAANSASSDGSGGNMFKSTSGSTPLSPTVEYPSEDDASSKQSQERINDKFVSSLSKSEGDERSITSNRSNASSKTNQSSSSRKEPALSSALGLTRYDEFEDDPNQMIESIHDMLAECRGILNNDRAQV